MSDYQKILIHTQPRNLIGRFMKLVEIDGKTFTGIIEDASGTDVKYIRLKCFKTKPNQSPSNLWRTEIFYLHTNAAFRLKNSAMLELFYVSQCILKRV